MAERPDPYSSPDQLVGSDPGPQRRRPTVLLVVVLVAVLAAGIGSFTLLRVVDAPADTSEWAGYPSVAGAKVEDILAQPTLEQTKGEAGLIMEQFRAALTERLGLDWTQVRDSFDSRMQNGYGGESMLWFHSSAAWEGSVTIEDPAARQTVLDVFTELTAEHGLGHLVVRNDLSPAHPEREFGATERPAQALWSFTSWGDPILANLTLSSEVIDLSIPRAEAFDGDFGFSYAVEGDTLYVTVAASAPMLLAEADLSAFTEALAPFAGRTPPAR